MSYAFRNTPPRTVFWPLVLAVGLAAALLARPVHGKLPPPTPAEQAVTAQKAETERTQKATEQVKLAEVQDRLAARFGKNGNSAPGMTTPQEKLPKNVAEAPGTAGPHGDARPSAEAHSGNVR